MFSVRWGLGEKAENIPLVVASILQITSMILSHKVVDFFSTLRGEWFE